MSASSEVAALTPQQKWESFVQGARCVFSRWTALCLAVENGWGGLNSRRKGELLLERTLHMFSNLKPETRLYADELEDMFFAYFDSEFFTDPQDESVEQVSRLLAELHYRIFLNDLTLLHTTLNARVPKGSQASIFDGPREEDEESGEEESEASQTETDTQASAPTSHTPAQSQPTDAMEVDPEGWQTVARKGKKK